MQNMFFQQLQQRPAMTVHDALGHAGRARGVHDKQRMTERQRFKSQRGTGDPELRERYPAPHCMNIFAGVGKRHDDGRRDTRNRRDDSGSSIDTIELLAVVEVGVGREQGDGLDLPEPVEHATRAKVRRA